MTKPTLVPVSRQRAQQLVEAVIDSTLAAQRANDHAKPAAIVAASKARVALERVLVTAWETVEVES